MTMPRVRASKYGETKARPDGKGSGPRHRSHWRRQQRPTERAMRYPVAAHPIRNGCPRNECVEHTRMIVVPTLRTATVGA